MTEDYKERIIKYLTNNYNREEENTNPFFVNNVEEKTLNIQMREYFDIMQGYIQGKDGKGNDLDIGFIYGTQDNKGVIVVVDDLFNILQVINEYNTGTDFNQWLCLNIDNSNGNIYGVDKQGNQTRFILLNNFLVKTPTQTEYEVKLRNSYFIDINYEPNWVEKSPNSSLYAMLGTNNATPIISTYQIEVGSTNTLTTYTYDGIPAGDLLAYNIEWTGDNYLIKTCTSYTDTQGRHYEEYKLATGDSEISLSQNIIIFVNNIGGIVMTNEATYIACNSKASSTVNVVRILKITSNDTNIIYEEVVEFDNSYNGLLYKKNNLVYGLIYIAINQPAQSANTLYKIEMGIIDNNDNFLSTSNTNMPINAIMGYIPYEQGRIFDVKINYNLLSYNLVTLGNRMLQAKQIYNSNNWNYEDYQDYNSMIPTSGILYDENGNVIFARNLYNKTISGNSTTSVLEIPNMLLNDVKIAIENLLGGTNGVIVNNEEDIEKNIYEDLFINFINTITMQNQNTQQYVSNLNGATRLNASISNTIDYTDTTLNRIRINYQDGTSFIKTISPASQVSQFVYKYTFNIYVTKLIDTIELISNDTNTIYLTIDGSNLEIDKAYKISQNVEIQ